MNELILINGKVFNTKYILGITKDDKGDACVKYGEPHSWEYWNTHVKYDTVINSMIGNNILIKIPEHEVKKNAE